MKRLAILALTALGVAGGTAAAAPHKILVLPVDGTADAATRAKLTAQIVKFAKDLEGQVSTAEATYTDTALAVGCDPQTPSCSDQVLSTLAVDELVWATATKDNGRIKLVVRRARKAAAPREISTTIAAGDSADRIDAGIASLFIPPGTIPDPTGPNAATAPPPGTGEVVTTPSLTQEVPDHDRPLGIGLAAGGGAAFVLGLALWASYASLQDSIDHHPTRDRNDFADLIALEDRASSYAITGDCLVLVGLAAGGLGAYYLYRSHHRHHIAVTPAPIVNGTGLMLTILGGL
ncbi:MAG TPA: hypothetical protein VHN14_34095 [Kofleriaceae bacterium]|jgi:hypothetical protein|nr:hypothetical protein [Kofleriaceae bacterium]